MNSDLLYKINNAPKKPGIYIWKKDNDIIYIGKAKNIFNRIQSYLKQKSSLDKTFHLVNEANDIDFNITNSENDALVLEASLINKYKPKYNILLREKHLYPYIVLTNEINPRLIYTHTLKKFNGLYFGPFASRECNCYEIYKLLNKYFLFRKCHGVLPKKKCLYYDMHQCCGPCINKIEPNYYDEMIKECKSFFAGNNKQILKNLSESEKNASNKREYEVAKQYHDIITGIKNITQVVSSNIHTWSNNSIDIIGYYVKNDYIAITVYTYFKNTLQCINKQIEKLYSDNYDDELLSYIMQFYYKNKNTPSIVYVNFLNDLNSLTKILGINFISPKVNSKYYKLVNSANENAKSFFTSDINVHAESEIKNAAGLLELNKLLNSKIDTIHMFDMAFMHNTTAVGGRVSFSNNHFNKNDYRIYNIKNTKSKSDVEYLSEVILRSYKTRSKLPDLIIADGGIIQVNCIKKQLSILSLENIMVIGLIKNNKHKTEKLLWNNSEYELDQKSDLYFLLASIQDTVHNFTISFFRKKYKKQFNN